MDYNQEDDIEEDFDNPDEDEEESQSEYYENDLA
jgi:hypothetical protein